MQATGTLPEGWERLGLAERIYQQQKNRLQQRYGPSIQWWNDRIQEIQPGNPFVVRDASSWRSARQLFEQNPERVPANMWKATNSAYYIPVLATHPYGVKSIENMLATEQMRRNVPVSSVPEPTIVTQPAEPEGDHEAERLLQGGHGSPAYRCLVDQLFSAPGFEAEHAVGQFLSRNPTPSRPQVEAFIESLPEDLADDVQSGGWVQIVRQVDRQIIQILQDPLTRRQLSMALGTASASVITRARIVRQATDGIRRTVFLRTAGLIKQMAS